MKKVEGFFYGLYMDASVLEKSGIVGEDRRLARVDDLKLVIGKRATLVDCIRLPLRITQFSV